MLRGWRRGCGWQRTCLPQHSGALAAFGTRGRTVKRNSYFSWALLLAIGLVGRLALADAYDPPAGYYSPATGTGATLKGQLHGIIDGHTERSYDQLRSDLQVTDVDPNNSSRIVLIYNNRVSIAKPTGARSPVGTTA